MPFIYFTVDFCYRVCLSSNSLSKHWTKANKKITYLSTKKFLMGRWKVPTSIVIHILWKNYSAVVNWLLLLQLVKKYDPKILDLRRIYCTLPVQITNCSQITSDKFEAVQYTCKQHDVKFSVGIKSFIP